MSYTCRSAWLLLCKRDRESEQKKSQGKNFDLTWLYFTERQSFVLIKPNSFLHGDDENSSNRNSLYIHNFYKYVLIKFVKMLQQSCRLCQLQSNKQTCTDAQTGDQNWNCFCENVRQIIVWLYFWWFCFCHCALTFFRLSFRGGFFYLFSIIDRSYGRKTERERKKSIKHLLGNQ